MRWRKRRWERGVRGEREQGDRDRGVVGKREGGRKEVGEGKGACLPTLVALVPL